MSDVRFRADLVDLVERPSFRRFMLAVVEASGICISAVKDDMALRLEGRRALGLEMLGWIDAALPATSDSSQPFGALHLILAEALTPEEKPHGDRRRTDDE